MAKGSRSRLELRRQHEAAEAREEQSKKQGEDEDLGDLDDGDEAEDDTATAEAPVKKKAAKKKTTGEAKSRKKVAKVVRKRVVWAVYDNSNKKVAQFDYNQRAEADAYAEKMKTEKKLTYFVQPLKEEIPS